MGQTTYRGKASPKISDRTEKLEKALVIEYHKSYEAFYSTALEDHLVPAAAARGALAFACKQVAALVAEHVLDFPNDGRLMAAWMKGEA